MARVYAILAMTGWAACVVVAAVLWACRRPGPAQRGFEVFGSHEKQP